MRVTKERKDISKGIRIEKIDQNQELTQLVGGQSSIYGHIQQKTSCNYITSHGLKYI